MTRETITTRERVKRRVSALETERSGRMALWGEIDRVLMPLMSMAADGAQSPQNSTRNDILDSSATFASGILAAGMQSGMTSPARPWVNLETEDTDLMNVKSVSKWCDTVTQKMRTIFSRSNTYKSLHGLYEELGNYGVMAGVVLPDYKQVIHHYPMTIGEFCISADDRGEVDTFSRKLQMTVGQIVQRFVARGSRDESTWDWSKVTPTVKNLWDKHNVDSWVPVHHLVQPRQDRDSRKSDNRNMPFESINIEAGGTEDRVLSESGYKRFPALVTRWQTKGTGIYPSRWPGVVALGDIAQLQHQQLRKAQGIDYMTKPPLQVPVSLKNQDSDFLPGGVTYVDAVGPQNAVRTAFDVKLDLNGLLADIQDVRGRIDRAFHADLFLFLSNIQGLKGQMTAREVAEIHEEKLLMLGPVVENIENELLAPLIDITFDAMVEAGILPPPPPELEDQPIQPEFIGLLSQAQRLVSMGSVDRIVGAVASIATAKQDPSVWDKLDIDKVIDKGAKYLGVDAEIIRGDDEVDAMRQQRAEAMQAQAQADAAAQAAATAKDMAGADMSTDNALTNVVRGFAG